MDTLPSAPRLNAEGGGNQAITVLAGVSGVSAPDVAIIMTSALKSPAHRVVCLHGTSADVMAITEGSIVFAPKTPRIPETDHSDAQVQAIFTLTLGSCFEYRASSLRTYRAEVLSLPHSCPLSHGDRRPPTELTDRRLGIGHTQEFENPLLAEALGPGADVLVKRKWPHPCEKTKPQQQQLSRERRDREKCASRKSSANLLSVYDDGFARRAGEIIARAVAALRQPQCPVRLQPRAGSSRGVNGGNRSAARHAGQAPRR